MTYRTTVLATGGTTAGIPVPDDVLGSLGGGRRPAVAVVVNGYTYRTTPGSRGGGTLLPLSSAHRAAAGLAAGDDVEVSLELDHAPRDVVVPPDLAAALAAAATTDAWAALAPSHRREHVRAVEEAKKPETRARRVAAVIDRLRG